MIARAFKLTTLTMLSICLTSCGLGTEIGNGLQPKKDEDGKKSNKAAAEDADSDNLGTDGGGSSEGDPVLSAPNVDADSIHVGTTSIPKSLLFAGCGSPFAAELDLPFDLITTVGENLVWRVDAGLGDVVTLRGKEETDAWDIDRTDTGALITKDENGELFSEIYECETAVEHQTTQQAEAMFVDAAHVTISAGDVAYRVSWAISYGAENAPRRLKSISIVDQTAEGGTSVELKARY